MLRKINRFSCYFYIINNYEKNKSSISCYFYIINNLFLDFNYLEIWRELLMKWEVEGPKFLRFVHHDALRAP